MKLVKAQLSQGKSEAVSVFQRNDDISLLVECFHVPMGLRNLLERICSVDDRLYFSGLNKFLENGQIVRASLACARDTLVASILS